MGDLTEHFSAHEFRCRGKDCCNHSVPDVRLLAEALQALKYGILFWQKERGNTGRSASVLAINSGFRCRMHNADISVRGWPSSKHLLGMAADVQVPEEMTVDEFRSIALTIPAFRRGGIIVYDWGLHLDIREGGSYREDKRTEKP